MYDRVDWYPASHVPVKMDSGQWCIWSIGYVIANPMHYDLELVEMMYEERDGEDVLFGCFLELAPSHLPPTYVRRRLAGLDVPPPPSTPPIFYVGLNIGDDDLTRTLLEQLRLV